MHQALLLVAAAVARAHDAWLLGVGRRCSLAGRIPHLAGGVARLEAECDLLRARLLRVPASTLSVRFLDGDPLLPILRLRRAT